MNRSNKKSKFFLVFFFLLIGVYYALLSPIIQTKLAKRALVELKKEFGTDILMDSTRINYFGKIYLYGLRAKDHKNFQFITIKSVEIKISPLAIFNHPNILHFTNLILTNPQVQVKTYTGDKMDNFNFFINKFNQKKSKGSRFVFKANAEIKNGVVSIFNQNHLPHLQEKLNAKHVSGTIKNLVIEKGSVLAHIRNITFDAVKNKKKYKLIELTTDLKIQNKRMYFDEIRLQTSHSNLKGKLHFDYEKSEDFKNFVYAVAIDLRINPGSSIGYHDLRYFGLNWNANEVVNLVGRAKGRVNDFSLYDFKLIDGWNRLESKKIRIKNAQNSALGFYFKGEQLGVDSGYENLKKILPLAIYTKIPRFLNRLGQVKYQGDLELKKGLIFIDTGKISTKIGAVEVNQLSVADYQNKNNIRYKGTIKTTNLELEKAFGIKNIGILTSNIALEGVGLTGEATVYAKGQVNEIGMFNKTLKNIILDGHLSKRVFTGSVSVADDKIAGAYNGTFDFSKKNYSLTFDSTLHNSDLSLLDGFGKKAQLSAKIKGDFSFTNANDFLGEIKLIDVQFNRGDRTFVYDEIHLNSFSTHASKKNYKISIPHVLEGKVSGNFDVKNMPKFLMESFNKLFVDDLPFSKQINESIRFDFTIQNDFFAMFYPKINIGKEVLSFNGAIFSNEDWVYFDVGINDFLYDNLKFSGTKIHVDNKKEGNPFLILIQKMQAGEVDVKDIVLETGKPTNDTLQIKTKFVLGKKNSTSFALNLFQTKDKHKINIGFNASEIVINNKLWQIAPSKKEFANLFEINTKNKTISIYNINLFRQNQELILSANYLNNKDYYLNATLSNVKLEEVIPQGALGSISLGGMVNGTFDLVKTPVDFLPVIKTNIQNFRLNEWVLGEVNFNSKYNDRNKVFESDFTLLNENKEEILFANGTIDNKSHQSVLDSTVRFNEMDMGFVGVFLKNVLSDFSGKLNGEIKVAGPFNNIFYGGKLWAKNMGFKVDYLSTKYIFRGENELIVKNNALEIPKTKFHDTKENTEGFASGYIFFEKFKNILVDLYFSSNKLLVMDTHLEDNESFYGNLYFGGDLLINGPTNDISIEANGDIVNNSTFSINLGKTATVSDNKIVTFVPSLENFIKNGDMGLLSSNKNQQKGNVNLDFKIKIQPDSKINIIFDEKSGDQIAASGVSQNLRFQMNNMGKMQMNGVYDLVDGAYYFRRILNKDFALKKGSTITWTGDVYKADLDIEAIYSKVISNVGEYLESQFAQSINTNLILHITDQLSKPNISFSIKAPDAPLQIQQELETRFSNPDEVKRQFGAVLAVGKFISAIDQSTSGLTSSAYEVGLKQIGDVISSLNQNLNVNFEYTQNNVITSSPNNFKTSVRVKINDRLNLNTIFGINFNNNNIINNRINNSFTGQFELEWDITKNNDGGLLIRTFSKPTFFGLESYNTNSENNNNNTTVNFTQSYGGGIVFRKSYDSLRELFFQTTKTKE